MLAEAPVYFRLTTLFVRHLGESVNAYETIVSKRDRREYGSRPIPEETLLRILQAGRMAGSSSNTQPCRFIVLDDREVLEALAPAGPGTAPMLRAPLAIAVVLLPGGTGFDVGRVCQNMMLAAWAEGVISCPQGIRDQALARSALGLPADHSVGMCLAFGYPDENAPARPSRPRLPFEELVRHGRW